MGLTSISIPKKSFTFDLESNGRKSLWVCRPFERNQDVIQLDLESMIATQTKFNVGSLATFHHKISLKAFTTQNINQFDGAEDVLNKLVEIKAITKADIQIIKQHLLGDN